MVWVRLPPINVCGFSPFSSPLLSSATSAQWSVQCQERPQRGRDYVKTEENSFSSLRETFGLFELCDLVVLIVQWGSFQGTGVLSKFSNLAQSSVFNLFDKVSLVLKILLTRTSNLSQERGWCSRSLFQAIYLRPHPIALKILEWK